MSLIKDNKKLFILILVLILIGGGAYYFTAILSSQLETLSSLREENTVKENELKNLQDQLKRLPEKQDQLKEMQMEINSLNNQIPSYQASVMMMMEIMQYMDIYNFEDTQVKMGEPLPSEDEGDSYFTIPVTINYTTTYDNTIQFVEELNRSPQLLTVESLAIDNGVQEKEAKGLSQVIPDDWVEAQVILSLYYKEQDETIEYPNYMEFFNREENVFLRSEVDEKSTPSKSLGVAEQQKNERAKEDTLFDLNLADIFRSGDNYSFSAYSLNQDPVYLGLTSGVDTKISLTIRDNSYTCLIEDVDGKKSEKKVDIRVKNPSISITSQIQKVMEDMPVVRIYVYNYTQNVVDVKMRGSELQNILIYNENGALVPEGKQVGKVALTI